MPQSFDQNVPVLTDKEIADKDIEFLFLKMKYGINFSETSYKSKLNGILQKLKLGETFKVSEVKWLFKNKLHKVVAYYYEYEYAKNKDLYNATNAFRFWFKAGDVTKSEYFANLLLLETLSLEDEVLRKSRRYYEVYKYTYDDYLHTDLWKITQAIALKRARGKCQVCNSSEHLQVHHRSYDLGLGNEVTTDLTVLCRDCHSLFHKNQKKRLIDDLKQS